MSSCDTSQQNGVNNTTKTTTQRTKSQYVLFKSRIQRSLVFTSTTLVSLLIASNFHPQIIHLIIAPLITMCVSLSTYLLNDIVDIKVDKINDPSRPLVSGQVSRFDAIILVTVLSGASLGLAYLVNTTVLFLTVGCLLVGSLYSVPKISLKDRFVIKTIAVAVGGFLGSMIGSSAISMFDERAVVSAISFMVLIFVTSPINDLADYVGDKNNGRKTIPIVIGQRNTVLVAITIPFIIALSFWFFYEYWNFHVTAPISLTLLAITSFIILFPIFSKADDYKYVRKRHKKAVLLHYGLQIALIIGVLV